MDHKPNQQDKAEDQTAEINKIRESGDSDTEFAEDFSAHDYRSAFKNPKTGEERLY
ncbi:MAG: hypothetical protein KID09_29795 [Paenibacillus macerans]|uniref:hypothetical protein n=1 Tax=Paenibacillus macerans TaxID=44252 RepID=UPI00242A465F|nr:hypothetical protein [Paenibacillus macerans]MBS5914759.1 hypothetical protein [Paenibacillus macerans]MDU5947067.1 hypothetical protein [Paenibacillus macerans]